MIMPTWKDVMKFNLSDNPIIFDLGGYMGEWTQIAKDYYPNAIVYVFEPVKKHYDIIYEKFKNDNNVKIFNFGLSDKNDKVKITLTGDSSSIHLIDDNSEEIELIDIRDFLLDNKIFKVDLIKINIEGEEYNLLEYLCSTPELNIFENYLVQFHKFIDNYEVRRSNILNIVRKYYDIIFNYEMVFEGWSIKNTKKIGCIGDSHVSIFSNSETIIELESLVDNERFTSYRMGSWLAYNLDKRVNEIKNVISQMDEETILFCFGEIDCRSQVKKISEDNNKPYTEVIEDIVRNYFIMIDNITDKKILIHSITPELVENPHHYYYKDHLEDFDCPRGTLCERKEYKEVFNNLVKNECELRNIGFINIYDMLETSKYKTHFYLDDIHLVPNNVKYMIKRALIENDNN